MDTIGFVLSQMPEETRIAIVPDDIKRIKHVEMIYIEEGYGKRLGIPDKEYQESGANIVTRHKALEQNVLCLPKPWIDDIDFFRQGQTIMGWLYLTEKKMIARAVIDKQMTAISWENMYGKNREYVFTKNRWYAGYIATSQALPFAYASPQRLKIGVLGRGRVAKGVFARLKEENANYEAFGRDRYLEFRGRLHEFDVVINCWYYDPAVGNYITLNDLQEMRAGALFIDVTCEGVEGSIPHPSISPFYKLGRFNPIIVYNNNHAPTMWPLEVSESISKALTPYLDKIITHESDTIIESAISVNKGRIIDGRIKDLLA